MGTADQPTGQTRPSGPTPTATSGPDLGPDRRRRPARGPAWGCGSRRRRGRYGAAQQPASPIGGYRVSGLVQPECASAGQPDAGEQAPAAVTHRALNDDAPIDEVSN